MCDDAIFSTSQNQAFRLAGLARLKKALQLRPDVHCAFLNAVPTLRRPARSTAVRSIHSYPLSNAELAKYSNLLF